MRLRPYRQGDEKYIVRWVDSERIHKLWCAGQIVYPMTEEAFEQGRKAGIEKWGNSCFTATKEDLTPVGYFQMSICEKENSAFMGWILVDSSCRGEGLGSEMVELAKKCAFELAGVDRLRLAVFDCNEAAVNCYRKCGFEIISHEKDAFPYGTQMWGRYLLEVHRGRSASGEKN